VSYDVFAHNELPVGDNVAPGRACRVVYAVTWPTFLAFASQSENAPNPRSRPLQCVIRRSTGRPGAGWRRQQWR